jgi:hypothetical protein
VVADIVGEVDTDYEMRYDIVAAIDGPMGISIPFRSIWQVDIGTDRPRLITMFPE